MTQNVNLKVAGQTLVTWNFTMAKVPPQMAVNIPENLFQNSQFLELEFEVTPIANSKKLGINQDDRNLGVFLKEVSFQQIASSSVANSVANPAASSKQAACVPRSDVNSSVKSASNAVSKADLEFQISFNSSSKSICGLAQIDYDADEWLAPEADGRWTRVASTHMHIPDQLLASGDLLASFDLASFASLGFHEMTQTVTLRVNDQVITHWDLARNQPVQALTAKIPNAIRNFRKPAKANNINNPSNVNKGLDITLEISPLTNPKALNVSEDTRDLGIFMRGFKLQPRAHSIT